jgi:hypothetical protein
MHSRAPNDKMEPTFRQPHRASRVTRKPTAAWSIAPFAPGNLRSPDSPHQSSHVNGTLAFSLLTPYGQHPFAVAYPSGKPCMVGSRTERDRSTQPTIRADPTSPSLVAFEPADDSRLAISSQRQCYLPFGGLAIDANWRAERVSRVMGERDRDVRLISPPVHRATATRSPPASTAGPLSGQPLNTQLSG